MINFKIPEINILYFFVILLTVSYLFFAGCKEPFQPEINEQVNAIAVDGSLIKGREKQVVTITRSAPLNNIAYLPVKDCRVKITDELNDEFPFTEESDGMYTAVIDDNMLVNDRKYKLVFVTPNGNTYESAYETIIETAPVDSVYPVLETAYNSSSQKDEDVIQFYLDLKAPETGSRYYRWELTETYEIHSFYRIDAIYDGFNVIITPNLRDSVYYCWITSGIDELYSSNTVNLIINEKKKIPLNRNLANSRKMSVRYSLLIEQYALNEKAYDYWHQKKIELQESGGLYTAQPGQSKSNIENINDDTEKVLGYFWVSSLSEKRIFYEEQLFYRRPYGYCERDTFVIDTTYLGPFPVYITGDSMLGPLYTANRECFDCTLIGGTLEKPAFW
jgi:hypothetical protein